MEAEYTTNKTGGGGREDRLTSNDNIEGNGRG